MKYNDLFKITTAKTAAIVKCFKYSKTLSSGHDE